MLALVDCNACYASCEQIFRPDLRGKPIVVLSNNDGCIVTRNKEAKALNLPNLAPYFQIKELLAQHQVHVFSSNYELYGDTSRRIMRLLEDFSDEVEINRHNRWYISKISKKGVKPTFKYILLLPVPGQQGPQH